MQEVVEEEPAASTENRGENIHEHDTLGVNDFVLSLSSVRSRHDSAPTEADGKGEGRLDRQRDDQSDESTGDGELDQQHHQQFRNVCSSRPAIRSFEMQEVTEEEEQREQMMQNHPTEIKEIESRIDNDIAVDRVPIPFQHVSRNTVVSKLFPLSMDQSSTLDETTKDAAPIENEPDDSSRHLPPLMIRGRPEYRSIDMPEEIVEDELSAPTPEDSRTPNDDAISLNDFKQSLSTVKSRSPRTTTEVNDNVEQRLHSQEDDRSQGNMAGGEQGNPDVRVPLSSRPALRSFEIQEVLENEDEQQASYPDKVHSNDGRERQQLPVPLSSRATHQSFQMQEDVEQMRSEPHFSGFETPTLEDRRDRQQVVTPSKIRREDMSFEMHEPIDQTPRTEDNDRSVTSEDMDVLENPIPRTSRPEYKSSDIYENVEEMGHDQEVEGINVLSGRQETSGIATQFVKEIEAVEKQHGNRTHGISPGNSRQQQSQIPLPGTPEDRSFEFEEKGRTWPPETPTFQRQETSQNSETNEPQIMRTENIRNLSLQAINGSKSEEPKENNQPSSVPESKERRMKIAEIVLESLKHLSATTSQDSKHTDGTESSTGDNNVLTSENSIVPTFHRRAFTVPEMGREFTMDTSDNTSGVGGQFSRSVESEIIVMADGQSPVMSEVSSNSSIPRAVDETILYVPEPSMNRQLIPAHAFDSSRTESIHILPNSPQKRQPDSSVSTEISENITNTNNSQVIPNTNTPVVDSLLIDTPSSESEHSNEETGTENVIRIGTSSSHTYSEDTAFYQVEEVTQLQSSGEQPASTRHHAERAMGMAMAASDSNPVMRENLSMVSIMAQTPPDGSPMGRERNYRNRDRLLNATIRDSPFQIYSETNSDTIATPANAVSNSAQTSSGLSFVSSVSPSDRLITMANTVVPSARFLTSSSNNMLSATRYDQPFRDRVPQSDSLIFPLPRPTTSHRDELQTSDVDDVENETIHPTIETSLASSIHTTHSVVDFADSASQTSTEDSVIENENQRHKEILALAQELSSSIGKANGKFDKNAGLETEDLDKVDGVPVSATHPSAEVKDSASQTTDGQGEISYRREESVVENRATIQPSVKLETGPLLTNVSLWRNENHGSSAFMTVSSPPTDTFIPFALAPTMPSQTPSEAPLDAEFHKETIEKTDAPPPSIDGRERSPLSRRREVQQVEDSNIQNEIEKLKKEHDKMMDLLKRSRDKKADKKKNQEQGKPAPVESDSSSADSPVTVISKNGTPSVSDAVSPIVAEKDIIISETCLPEESIFNDPIANIVNHYEITTQVDFPEPGRLLNRSQESQTDSSFESHIEELLLKVPECAAFSMPPSTTNFDHRDGVFKPAPKVLETVFTEDRAIGSDSPINGYDERTTELIQVSSQTLVSAEVDSRESSGDRSMISRGSNVSFVDDEVESLLSRSHNNHPNFVPRLMVSTGTEASVDSSDDFTQTDMMDESSTMIHATTIGSSYSSHSDSHDVSNIQRELERLNRERIEIIELLSLKYLPSSLTIELLERKLSYCIGQTDLLLETLEDVWGKEDLQPNRSTKLLNITKQYIEDYRSQFSRTTKDITACLETHQRRKQGTRGRRRTRGSDITLMKRRAEIEAFKLERLREECRYERQKAKDKSFSPSSSYRGNHSHYSNDMSFTSDNIDAMTPSQRKSYLINLRRQLVSGSAHEMSELRRVSMSPRPGSAHSMDEYWGHRPSSYSPSPARSESPSTSFSSTIRRVDFDLSQNSLHFPTPSSRSNHLAEVPKRPHSALPVVSLERDLRSNVIATFTTHDGSIEDLLEESNKIRQQNQMQISQAQEALKELDRKRKQHSSDERHHEPTRQTSPNAQRDASGGDTSQTSTDYRMNMFSRELSPAQTSSPRVQPSFAAQARDHLARSERLINSFRDQPSSNSSTSSHPHSHFSSFSPSYRTYTTTSHNATNLSHKQPRSSSSTSSSSSLSYRSPSYFPNHNYHHLHRGSSTTIPAGRIISRHKPIYRASASYYTNTNTTTPTPSTTFGSRDNSVGSSLSPSPHRQDHHHHHHLHTSHSPHYHHSPGSSSQVSSSGFHSRLSHSATPTLFSSSSSTSTVSGLIPSSSYDNTLYESATSRRSRSNPSSSSSYGMPSSSSFSFSSSYSSIPPHASSSTSSQHVTTNSKTEPRRRQQTQQHSSRSPTLYAGIRTLSPRFNEVSDSRATAVDSSATGTTTTSSSSSSFFAASASGSGSERTRSDTPLSACSMELDAILFPYSTTTTSDGALLSPTGDYDELFMIHSRPISAQDIKANLLEKRRTQTPK